MTASTWKMHGAGVLTSALKQVCDIPVFAYGHHVSAIPDRTLREEKIDFVVLGEGFDTATELVQAVGNPQLYPKIRGLWYKLEDGTVSGNNEVRIITDLDSIPFDGFDMLPNVKYRNHFHNSIADRLQCPLTAISLSGQDALSTTFANDVDGGHTLAQNTIAGRDRRDNIPDCR